MANTGPYGTGALQSASSLKRQRTAARVPSGVPAAYRGAIAKYARLVQAEAAKYGLTGEELLAKGLKGESGFRMSAVSSANARGAAQFIPSTRASYIKKYGVDPWRSVDEAVHAMAIYYGSSGVASYNPGMKSYTSYIVNQKVGGAPSSGDTGSAAGGGGEATAAGDGGGLFDEVKAFAAKALLWVVLLGAGAVLIFRGTTRAVGVRSGVTGAPA